MRKRGKAGKKWSGACLSFLISKIRVVLLHSWTWKGSREIIYVIIFLKHKSTIKIFLVMMWKVLHKCLLKTNYCSALQLRALKLEFFPPTVKCLMCPHPSEEKLLFSWEQVDIEKSTAAEHVGHMLTKTTILINQYCVLLWKQQNLASLCAI